MNRLHRSNAVPLISALVLFATLAAAPGPARAAESPEPRGDAAAGVAGSATYRDRSSGRITGSSSRSPTGTTTYRDADGRITGTSSTDENGRTTVRDSRGAIAVTADTVAGSNGDSTTWYRRNGVIVGQKYVSPAGNVTWRDGDGRIIAGPNW